MTRSSCRSRTSSRTVSRTCSRCSCVSRPAGVGRGWLRGACLRDRTLCVPLALSSPGRRRSVVTESAAGNAKDNGDAVGMIYQFNCSTVASCRVLWLARAARSAFPSQTLIRCLPRAHYVRFVSTRLPARNSPGYRVLSGTWQSPVAL